MITTKKQPDSVTQIDKILHPWVKQWFYSKFNAYSSPQQFGVMDIHSRKNILLSAPTGCGKTLTGFLSILNELVDSADKGILEDKTYALYISPLKALNYDIRVNLEEPLAEIEHIAGKSLGIRVGVRTGDTTASQRAALKKTPPHILITTPESLAIMLNVPSSMKQLHDVQWCIIDEIHALAENKRGVHLSLSLERLQRHSPGLTRVGLSATVAPLEEVAQFLVGTNRDCTIVSTPLLKQLDLQVLSPVKDLVKSSYDAIQKKTYELLNDLIQSHKTTLVFTNTRAGTERIVHQLKQRFPKQYHEINEEPPHEISCLIGAHHGSLSKEHRFSIEQKLRDGKLKCVTCSTSLELGIDIGSIDLVVLLGSPKSTARLLQRVGRAGHQLHATTKGRLIVQDRDDLLECSIMLKEALDGHIDRLHIPTHCADVLAQHLLGLALEQVWSEQDAYDLITSSYCFADFSYTQFLELLSYLSGEFISLEQRHVYGKIWREDGKFGKKGRMTRVLYLTNVGTIPDQGGVAVKVGPYQVGSIDEGFLESLKPGDIFVLGGDVYQFMHARGMVAQVRTAEGRKPTVPNWYSEMLPLSFDVAQSIRQFKSALYDKLTNKQKAIAWISSYLYVDEVAAQAIYNYCKAQADYCPYPTSDILPVEYYKEEQKHYALCLTSFGRRTNEALARALAFALSRLSKLSVEIAVTDHGFYLAATRRPDISRAIDALINEDVYAVLKLAVDRSEALKRRFRQCAGRALMILRNYKGRKKMVGKQQVSSMHLLHAVRQVSETFVILEEAKREVLEDVMDAEHAKEIIEKLRSGSLKIKTYETSIPSPFALHIVMRMYSDMLSAQDRQEFLQKMHQMVLAKISLDKGKKDQPVDFSYEEAWKEEE